MASKIPEHLLQSRCEHLEGFACSVPSVTADLMRLPKQSAAGTALYQHQVVLLLLEDSRVAYVVGSP